MSLLTGLVDKGQAINVLCIWSEVRNLMQTRLTSLGIGKLRWDGNVVKWEQDTIE